MKFKIFKTRDKSSSYFLLVKRKSFLSSPFAEWITFKSHNFCHPNFPYCTKLVPRKFNTVEQIKKQLKMDGFDTANIIENP